MIKVDRHPLLCDCPECTTLFPPDRFDARWPAPKPDRDDVRQATAGIPIGGSNAALRFTLWVDDDNRLACDWPGLPGTIGARVSLRSPPPGSPALSHVTGTDDIILAGFADGAPLRRKLTARFTARLMVAFGLATPDTADLVTCPIHGHGARASTCVHLQEAAERRDAVMLYGVDGDFPDLFCTDCVERLSQRDLSSIRTTCSRCLVALARHHRVVSVSWYGQ